MNEDEKAEKPMSAYNQVQEAVGVRIMRNRDWVEFMDTHQKLTAAERVNMQKPDYISANQFKHWQNCEVQVTAKFWSPFTRRNEWQVRWYRDGQVFAYDESDQS